MKKKLYLLIVSLIVATAAYAGVAYINYDTGEFTCTSSNQVLRIGVCNKNDDVLWAGYEYCQKQAANICN